RLHYALKRLHGIFIASLPSEPVYELKMAFSYHAYLCAEHITAVRQRVSEMREPPLGLEKCPHASLEAFFDEILKAPTTAELLVAIYELALPAVIRGFERHQQASHPLADQPTRRVGRFALLELREMLDYGQQAITCVVKEAERQVM